MNFTEKIKNEILSSKIDSNCCKIAALSAYLRTAGSIEIRDGKVGFSFSGENDANSYFKDIVYSLYRITPEIVPDKQGERSKMIFLTGTTAKVLSDTKIAEIVGNELDVELGISEKLIKKQCCQRAYMKGAFLGSGTATIPKIKSEKATGYHMEFVFSTHPSALDFSHLIAMYGYTPRMVERKETYVIYYKHSEDICDILVMLGAKNACLELQELILQRGVSNNTNRVINCELSNLDKQIDASLKSRKDILTISECLGLDSLPAPLQLVAKARLDYPNDTLSQLSARLNMTKSCLSHRLKRLSEIAESLI